ncbi:hypothetical protein PLESTB_001433100 [Pleodorina starrii]|uniref:Uncharacterized protein n=1 Tax=Pleodorina starrii TaxID=330485 RepID=A0A9W6BW99_9CHLO|nr:hypothetical protein PLESTM_001391900 [Pleodorina starrii]GLC59015.1 hypothetical protein PLESTB_001433100 [Pleodorina starrii]GLC67635.1 hypothetical protein PLESTF_000585200 [Pleodorina starrii]
MLLQRHAFNASKPGAPGRLNSAASSRRAGAAAAQPVPRDVGASGPQVIPDLPKLPSSSDHAPGDYVPQPTTSAVVTTELSAGVHSCSDTPTTRRVSRRTWLVAACLATGWAADIINGSGCGGGKVAYAAAGADAAASASAAARPVVDLSTLQEEAYLAYAERRFQDAVNLLTECIAAEPESARWREMRAEALVDGKNFTAALQDFEAALRLVPDTDRVTRARLRTGRALGYEGLSEWEAALADYKSGMELAAEAGESLDPYVLNSIGNCLNSLGRWEEAREQYLASAAVFQQARGFRGRNGSTTPRLDGAIFAASNAALMRAQLGDTDGAVQEMVRIARRAPGSADMRAALAALYWGQGRQREAEEMWEFACDRITVGCVKYTDLDWLGRIRRWPPAMVARMADFLAMR